MDINRNKIKNLLDKKNKSFEINDLILPDLEKEHIEEETNKIVDEYEAKLKDLELKLKQKDRIIEDIKKEYEKKIIEEKSKAFDEGYKKAEKDLEEKYKQILDNELKQYSSLIEDLVKNIENSKKEMLSLIERDFIEILNIFVEKIIYKKIEEDKEYIIKVLKDLVEYIDFSSKLQIYLNPNDLLILKSKEYLWQPIEAKKELIEYIPREDFSKGSVIVKSEKGIVDARVEERIKKLREKILELWENNVS